MSFINSGRIPSQTLASKGFSLYTAQDSNLEPIDRPSFGLTLHTSYPCTGLYILGDFHNLNPATSYMNCVFTNSIGDNMRMICPNIGIICELVYDCLITCRGSEWSLIAIQQLTMNS